MMRQPKIHSNLVQVGRAINLFRLGNNIAGVFVPLIILKSGGSLRTVGLFYLLYAMLKLGINYPLIRVIQRRGAHFGLSCGFAFSCLQIMCVLGYAYNHNFIFLAVSGALLALTNGFVTNSQHYYVSSHMDEATQSSSIAAIEIYGRTFDVLGPILGALIGSTFGAGWLLAVAILFIAASALPLRKMRTEFTRHDQSSIRYGIQGVPFQDIFANYCFNIEATIGVVLWPIYLAIVVHSYKSVGGITALAAIGAIVTTYISGKRGDAGKNYLTLRQGVVLTSLVDLTKLLSRMIGFIAVVSVGYSSSDAYLINPWTATYYDHAKKMGLQYIITMEIACDVAYVTVWAVFLIFVSLLHSTQLVFDVSFVVAAITAYGCLLITPQSGSSL